MMLAEVPFEVFGFNVANASINERLCSLFFCFGIHLYILATPSAFQYSYEAERSRHHGDCVLFRLDLWAAHWWLIL